MIKIILFLYSLTLGGFKKNIINDETYDLVERIASRMETIDDNEWKPLFKNLMQNKMTHCLILSREFLNNKWNGINFNTYFNNRHFMQCTNKS